MQKRHVGHPADLKIGHYTVARGNRGADMGRRSAAPLNGNVLSGGVAEGGVDLG